LRLGKNLWHSIVGLKLISACQTNQYRAIVLIKDNRHLPWTRYTPYPNTSSSPIGPLLTILTKNIHRVMAGCCKHLEASSGASYPGDPIAPRIKVESTPPEPIWLEGSHIIFFQQPHAPRKKTSLSNTVPPKNQFHDTQVGLESVLKGIKRKAQDEGFRLVPGEERGVVLYALR
jgi:hypothetical protein